MPSLSEIRSVIVGAVQKDGFLAGKVCRTHGIHMRFPASHSVVDDMMRHIIENSSFVYLIQFRFVNHRINFDYSIVGNINPPSESELSESDDESSEQHPVTRLPASRLSRSESDNQLEGVPTDGQSSNAVPDEVEVNITAEDLSPHELRDLAKALKTLNSG
jgi:hypothetical protein